MLPTEEWGAKPHGSRGWIYLGSNKSRASSARGRTDANITDVVVARFFQLAHRYDICDWMPVSARIATRRIYPIAAILCPSAPILHPGLDLLGHFALYGGFSLIWRAAPESGRRRPFVSPSPL